MIKGSHHIEEWIKMIRKISIFKEGHKINLGRHHSQKTRKKISKALQGDKSPNYGTFLSKEYRGKLSEAHKGIKLSLNHREAISEGHKGEIPQNMQRPGKFGNIQRGWYNILGVRMFFKSKWEANYALYLNFLVKHKQIKKWEYEPDVFVFEKIKFGTRSYRPDFKVFNLDGTIHYHEVKGYMDAKSKTKIKRMAKYYPKIRLIIIDSSTYREIWKKLGKMLKFYE